MTADERRQMANILRTHAIIASIGSVISATGTPRIELTSRNFEL